jgi:hypothetical protein
MCISVNKKLGIKIIFDNDSNIYGKKIMLFRIQQKYNYIYKYNN